jgi:hypothetical protein
VALSEPKADRNPRLPRFLVATRIFEICFSIAIVPKVNDEANQVSSALRFAIFFFITCCIGLVRYARAVGTGDGEIM